MACEMAESLHPWSCAFKLQQTRKPICKMFCGCLGNTEALLGPSSNTLCMRRGEESGNASLAREKGAEADSCQVTAEMSRGWDCGSPWLMVVPEAAPGTLPTMLHVTAVFCHADEAFWL